MSRYSGGRRLFTRQAFRFAETVQEPYLLQNKDALARYYGQKERTAGAASSEGTLKYFEESREYNKTILKQHFRDTYGGLKVASTGYGTYIGAPDQEEDLRMFNAMVESV